MIKLSKDLIPIYELELDRGNEVARIDEPAGSNCPYAIVFKNPLHKNDIETSLSLAPQVRFHEVRDSHYAKESYYFSERSRHAVGGPLAE